MVLLNLARPIRWPRLELSPSGSRQRRCAPAGTRYLEPTIHSVSNVSYALLRWGTEEQKHRFLEPIAKQREIWVQLFSEPGAGSDLAGLSTRAARDGEVWLVNGQKVWSSHAHRADWGFLLARTDPDVPKHQGLSVFFLYMKSPGITVRPLKQMTGEAFFNEVFFDDVGVLESMRFGELGQGWQIASNLLSDERVRSRRRLSRSRHGRRP